MNYATIKYYDIANGPGVRTSVFVSGCRHHCPGCFNEVAWDFGYGQPFDKPVRNEVFASCKPDYITGLSLLGGGYHEICCAIQNMVGNVTGMVCDGAKADCALKISTCVNAACQAAAMGARGVRVQSTDGIVEENVERTLDNFAILSTHGTSDSVILDLMLNKEHTPDAE